MLIPVAPVQIPGPDDILEAMHSGWALVKDDLGCWLYAVGNWRCVQPSDVVYLVSTGLIEGFLIQGNATEYILTPKYYASRSDAVTDHHIDDLHINQFSMWLVVIAACGGLLTLALVILRQLLWAE